MDRDALIDRLHAIACQYADAQVTLDGQVLSVADICAEAVDMLGVDADADA